MKDREEILGKIRQNADEIRRMRDYDEANRRMAKQPVYSLEIWVLEEQNKLLNWIIN